MDEKNININKSEEEALKIMENVSHITSDQLHGLYNRQIKKFPTEKQNVSLKHILT